MKEEDDSYDFRTEEELEEQKTTKNYSKIPFTKEEAISVLNGFIIKYPENDKLKKYILAVENTDFDDVNDIIQTKG